MRTVLSSRGSHATRSIACFCGCISLPTVMFPGGHNRVFTCCQERKEALHDDDCTYQSFPLSGSEGKHQRELCHLNSRIHVSPRTLHDVMFAIFVVVVSCADSPLLFTPSVYFSSGGLSFAEETYHALLGLRLGHHRPLIIDPSSVNASER